jgi:hypothetical protein
MERYCDAERRGTVRSILRLPELMKGRSISRLIHGNTDILIRRLNNRLINQQINTGPDQRID